MVSADCVPAGRSMPTELGPISHNPRVPSSRQIHQPDDRAFCPKPPSPYGALDLVLSGRCWGGSLDLVLSGRCWGGSKMMGGTKLLLWYQASLVLRALCRESV